MSIFGCFSVGAPAWGSKDLIPMGYISPTLIKTSPEVDANGQQVLDKSGNIVYQTQTLNLLPSSMLMLNFIYAQEVQTNSANAASFLGEAGGFSFPSLGLGSLGVIAQSLLGSEELGGAGYGTTNITFQICDASTVFNYPITISQETIDYSKKNNLNYLLLQLPNYPLGVLCATQGQVYFSTATKNQISSHVIRQYGMEANVDNTGQIASNLVPSQLYQTDKNGNQLKTLWTNLFISSYIDYRTIPYRLNPLQTSSSSNMVSIQSGLSPVADITTSPTNILQLFPNPTQTPSQIYEKDNISFISSVILQCQMERQFKAKLLGEQQLKEIKLIVNGLINSTNS